MLTVGRLFLGVLALICMSLLGLYYLSVDKKPAIYSFLNLSSADIEKAKKIISQQAVAQTSSVTRLQLTERDLNIAANHLLNRQIDSTSKIQLTQHKLAIISSINVSHYITDRFVNIRFVLSKQNGQPLISDLSIGKIAIPDHYASLLLDYITHHTPLKKYYVLAKQHIKSIQFSAQHLIITYIADQDTISQARQLISYPANKKTLLVYQKKLAEVLVKHNRGWLLSLSDLLQPLFKLAYQRSTIDSAVEENRHVIFVVSAYINKQQWQQFVPQNLSVLPSPSLPVYAYKRTDLAQHFIASAAITSLGSSFLANLMGLKKEIKDSEIGGSGFSFIDLAADRAGMYFGKIATSSSRNARIMQKEMAHVKDYTAFLPDMRDLPDRINQATLIKQYQSVDSQASQQILKHIDERIKTSPIYQAF